MSADNASQQRSLTDYSEHATQGSPDSERASWTPQDAQRRTCQSCGSQVTDMYTRVLGDQDNRVHECPHCPTTDSSVGRRTSGAAAGLTVTDRKVGNQEPQ